VVAKQVVKEEAMNEPRECLICGHDAVITVDWREVCANCGEESPIAEQGPYLPFAEDEVVDLLGPQQTQIEF